MNDETIRLKANLYDAMLSAQSRWTAVEDGNPESHKWYLVTWRNLVTWEDGEHNEYIGVTEGFYKGKGHWTFKEDIPDTLEVIAWMPLPHPYEPQYNLIK